LAMENETALNRPPQPPVHGGQGGCQQSTTNIYKSKILNKSEYGEQLFLGYESSSD